MRGFIVRCGNDEVFKANTMLLIPFPDIVLDRLFHENLLKKQIADCKTTTPYILAFTFQLKTTFYLIWEVRLLTARISR